MVSYIRDSTLIFLPFLQITIKTENMDLAGDVVQALVNFLGITVSTVDVRFQNMTTP